MIINPWLQQRRDFDDVQSTKPKKDKQNALVECTMEITTALLTNAKVARKRPGRPSVSSAEDKSKKLKRPRRATDLKMVPGDTRFDNNNHWPIHKEDRPKCFTVWKIQESGAISVTKDFILQRAEIVLLNIPIQNFRFSSSPIL